MLADLDLSLIAVFCTADDLLPESTKNARGRVTDAEVVTLCVAQQVMDIGSDREFLAVAAKRLSHLFPQLPLQPGYLKRRRRLADTIEWLCGVFAQDSPGWRRRARAARLDTGGMRALAGDRTPLRAGRRLWLWLLPLPFALVLGHAPAPRRRSRRHPQRRDPGPGRPTRTRGRAQTAATGAARRRADHLRQGLRGEEFKQTVAQRFGATVLRPSRKDEPDTGPQLSSIRQRIESIFQTLKDRLGLERHRARTLTGLRARIAAKLLALAAGVWLNRTLGRPPRASGRRESEVPRSPAR
jgi:hypothetical protein